MKSVYEVLQEYEQYALWRTMRNEAFAWSTWIRPRSKADNVNHFLMLPSISRLGTVTCTRIFEHPLPSKAAYDTSFYRHFDSSSDLLTWMIDNMSWKAFPNVPAFPFSVENPAIKRPDFKYEIFSLIHRYYLMAGTTKFLLWNLNPETNDVIFTDTIPLLVSLDLH